MAIPGDRKSTAPASKLRGNPFVGGHGWREFRFRWAYRLCAAPGEFRFRWAYRLCAAPQAVLGSEKRVLCLAQVSVESVPVFADALWFLCYTWRGAITFVPCV